MLERLKKAKSLLPYALDTLFNDDFDDVIFIAIPKRIPVGNVLGNHNPVTVVDLLHARNLDFHSLAQSRDKLRFIEKIILLGIHLFTSNM